MANMLTEVINPEAPQRQIAEQDLRSIFDTVVRVLQIIEKDKNMLDSLGLEHLGSHKDAIAMERFLSYATLTLDQVNNVLRQSTKVTKSIEDVLSEIREHRLKAKSL